MKKINKKAIGIVSLGALALIGGTFAYYTATNTLDNPLSTGDYNTVLVEEFTPSEDDIQPGAKWTKTAGAENTGDYPVLVRIKMNEKWQYKDGTSPYKTLTSESELFTNDEPKATSSNADPSYYLAQQVDDQGAVSADGDTDGYTPTTTENEGDGTVIHKNIVTEDSAGNALWVYNATDGYWYWNGVLEEAGSEKAATSKLLDGLVVTTNIDLGYYETKEYYAIAASQPPAADTDSWVLVEFDFDDTDNDVWPEADANDPDSPDGDGLIDIRDYLFSIGKFPVTDGNLYRMSSSEIDSDRKGYADSNYTLTITAEFVQATVDAATENWTDANSDWSSIVGSLTNITTSGIEYVNQ